MEQIEIKVNGVTIPEADILQEIQYHPAQDHRSAYIEAAKSLIIGELLRQQAAEKGYQVASDRFDMQNQDSVIEQLLNQEVEYPKACEEECLQYFESHPEKFVTSPLFEVRHILLGADPEDLEDRDKVRQLAEGIIEQLKSGEAFSDFVKHSSCPSKEVGGSLGQISKGQTVPEFEKALLLHQFNGVGDIAKLIAYPVESRFGFHIVMLDNRVDGKPLEFVHVKDKIKQYLDERVRHKALAQYVHLLLSEADIQGFSFEQLTSPLVQ